MKFQVLLQGAFGAQQKIVELERHGDTWRILLDGVAVDGDIAGIDAHTVSVLLAGRSYVVQITSQPNSALKVQTALQEFTAEVADPRAWRGRHHSLSQAEGRQQIVAPMPGKIVRVLVDAGDQVAAGQGLLVVEAMKMQNEIRSPKTGTIERLMAKEGQPVNAGEVLCVVS
jgi:biotin carboxyl carrier protein